MIPLPKWIRDGFRGSRCPHCNKVCKKKGVYGIGIREENDKDGNNFRSFCYEYKCPFCEKRSVFAGFPTSYEDFINDVMEIADLEPEDEEGPHQTLVEPKSVGMSDQEVNEGKRIVSSTDYFEDLLSKLGILDQYRDLPNEKNENK